VRPATEAGLRRSTQAANAYMRQLLDTVLLSRLAAHLPEVFGGASMLLCIRRIIRAASDAGSDSRRTHRI
jgi:hypothetical protein